MSMPSTRCCGLKRTVFSAPTAPGLATAPSEPNRKLKGTAMASPLALLKSRRLWPLCLSQACGAFNDNLTKNAMIVLAMFAAASAGSGLAALAGGLFIGPYMLLSATAGQLADRYEKSRLIR